MLLLNKYLMNMKRRVNIIDSPVLTFVYLTMLYFLDARNIAGYIIAVITYNKVHRTTRLSRET